MQLLASEVRADHYTWSPRIVSLSMLTITYIQVMALFIHAQGRFYDHAAHSLQRIMVAATNVVGPMKMGNNVPRAGLKPTSLAFWVNASYILLDITDTSTPNCL